MTAPLALPQAPAQLIQDHLPRFGSFSGFPGDAAFGRLGKPYKSGLGSLLVEKRWAYTLVSAPDVFLCMAVIDLGYLSSAFLGVFDRGARKLLFDGSAVLPPGFTRLSDDPSSGLRAQLKGLNRAGIERDGDQVHVHARWGKLAVELSLDARPALPAFGTCAGIGPEGSGRFDYTQKSVGLIASGEIKLGKLAFTISGAPAGLDYTHGQFAHETAWRWAFATGSAQGHKVGFNFSEGFLGTPGADGAENAVWVDGAPCSPGPVKFTFDAAHPDRPWTIASADGGVDLIFTPEGQRAQNTDLGLILSRYAQPFGTFRGHITAKDGARIAIDSLAGVTEDHAARW